MNRKAIFLYILLFFSGLECSSVKSHGFEHLSFSALASKFGTPLYVYSENRIRENYQKLHQAFAGKYPHCAVHYAVKANSNPAIIQILHEEGAGFDCSCLEEVMLVKQLGIPNEKLIYTGAYVPKASVISVIDQGIQMNMDCISVLDLLKDQKLPEVVSFRINPGLGMGGTEGLVFAGEDAKFGISQEIAEKAYAQALAMGARKFGAHMMTGSNVLDPSYFPHIVETLLDIIGPISQKLNITFEYIDLGGSFGIPYYPDDQALDIDQVAAEVIAVLKRKLLQYRMGEPKIILEPGRYLVGNSGILLTRVCSIKEGKKTFIGVDAGINTIYFLEGAYRHITAVDKESAVDDKPVTVVGPLCTNKDVLGDSISLPSAMKIDDVLCIYDVGAYGFCKSSQFNTRPRCAEVLVSNGHCFLIREAETFDDLFHKTVIPEHLRCE